MLILLFLLTFFNFIQIRARHEFPGIIQMTPNHLNQARFFRRKAEGRRLASIATIQCTNSAISLMIGDTGKHEFTRVFASRKKHISECTQITTKDQYPARFTVRVDGPCGVTRVYPNSSDVNSYQNHLSVIVSHDDAQMTRFDRIYDIICTHRASSVTVDSSFNVISFQPVQLSNENEEPEIECKYSLHDANLHGITTNNAKVGDTVYHRWTCNSDRHNFKVFNCQVFDANKLSYTIIDQNGCSVDEEIMQTPEYDMINHIIYAPSKAFRFATTNIVHFKCMISLCEIDNDCFSKIPPKCHRKRELNENLSIEQRLYRIRELMLRDQSLNQSIVGEDDMISIISDPLTIRETSYDVHVDQLVARYQFWTTVLCLINILQFSALVVISFRLIKNKYKMDIKNPMSTILRRVPF